MSGTLNQLVMFHFTHQTTREQHNTSQKTDLCAFKRVVIDICLQLLMLEKHDATQ